MVVKASMFTLYCQYSAEHSAELLHSELWVIHTVTGQNEFGVHLLHSFETILFSDFGAEPTLNNVLLYT